MIISSSTISRTVIISFILFCSISNIAAQPILVSGRVFDEKKEPIERAQITIKHTNSGRIVAYALSSASGEFSLKRDLKPDSLVLEFTCMGYASQTRSIPRDNQPLFIELATKSVAIREVVVNAKTITQRSDTVIYRVSAFSVAQDRTIADVLKRMPGIEVLETGEIKYQGVKLDKFYVEGSDMLGGRYSLATNNISHTDVASVEILENHQPIQAMQDIVFSGATAMNIKLKEDAKSRWAGTIKAGLGVPQLWTAELFAMRFKAKVQNLNTYKGNNTGGEYRDMTMFTPPSDFGSNDNASLPDYIQVAPSVASDIGGGRSNFSTTHNVSSNSLFKIGKDYDLTAEFTGSIGRRESEYISQTTYFLTQEQIKVEDKTENAEAFRRAFTGRLRLKANKKTYYLNNELNFSYDHNDNRINTLGTYSNNQNAIVKGYKIANNFEILQRYGTKFFTFRSNNEYSSKPQSLEITRDEKLPIAQNIKLSTFYSNNSLDYSINLGQVFRLSAPVRLTYQYRQIENELNDVLNDLSTHKLKLNITPTFDYNLERFKFALSGNMFYQTISLENRWHQIYGISPRFSANWIASPSLKMSASLAWSKDTPDENLFYRGNIINNYRTMTAGYVDFSCGANANASLNLEYKDVLKSLFANIGVMIMSKQNTKITGQDFEQDYILNYYLPGNTKSDMLSVYGSVSKGIEPISGTIAISPIFTKSKSTILRNEVTIPYSSNSHSLRIMANSKITDNFNVTYQIYGAHSRYQMESNQQYSSSSRLSQSLKATYAPIKSVQLSGNVEHFCNELSAGNFKHFLFSDISVSYLMENRWEFTCGVRNIFDIKHYSYFTETDLSTLYKSYKIRPRNILISATYRF